MHTLILLSLFACDDPVDPPVVDVADGADGGSADGGLADGGLADGGSADGGATGSLHGSPPDSPLPAPEFAAVNMDGAARSREDLLGQPTVMWFYPRAGTAG